ncbi:MAG TPA: FxsA family protein [Acidimicrobiales bacterium]|jgi:UPF0716 protein FxsA|nr:FxsA family protein [Acidimicrobiales bacterium]
MLALVVVLFIAELWVIVEVALRIGVLETIVLLLVMPFIGVWLVKRAGLHVLGRLRTTVDSGRTPHKELVDGFLVLMAGLLFIVPGFITDAMGLVLLFPPTRVVVRSMLIRSVTRRTSFAFRMVDGMGRRVDIQDVRSRDVTEPPRLPPELDH